MQMMGHDTNVLQNKSHTSLIYIVMLLQACLECPDFP